MPQRTVFVDPLVWAQFFELLQKQFACDDHDAPHPFFVKLITDYKLEQRHALWLTFLYMAFYDEASAWVAFQNSDPFTVPRVTNLTIGTNRRNLYGGRIIRHFEALKDAYNSAKGWPFYNFTNDAVRDWSILENNIESVWGNGRFAVFTTAEMVQKVNRAPVVITNFHNQGSTGPADAIRRLTKCNQRVTELDLAAATIYNRVVRTGLKPSYIDVDRGAVETILCNFSAMCRGKFYSGRNIDRQQGRILKVEKLGHNLQELWDLRPKVFKRECLGELNEWRGIDRPRLKLFQQTGQILWVYEGRK